MRRTKIWQVVVVIAGLAGIAGYHAFSPKIPAPTPSPVSTTPSQATSSQLSPTIQCNQDIWKFVYHPDRLPTKNDCRTVTGVVKWVKHEDDQDYHIRLQLDDPNSAPINSKNIGGYLVVEPICQLGGPPSKKSSNAIQACQQYVSAGMPQWNPPSVGDRIKVTGFYTLDKDHGWNEIHSVVSMEIIK